MHFIRYYVLKIRYGIADVLDLFFHNKAIDRELYSYERRDDTQDFKQMYDNNRYTKNKRLFGNFYESEYEIILHCTHVRVYLQRKKKILFMMLVTETCLPP